MKRRFVKGLVFALTLCLLLAALPAALADSITAVEEHCYIRNAPGLDGKILYTVPVGASATYLDDTSVDNRGVTWYYATYDGVTGWMSGLQISFNSSGGNSPDYDTVTAVEKNCYIRSAPGLDGKILYTVPVGDSAMYMYDTSVDNRGVIWYRVSYENIYGWMSGLQVSVNFCEDDSSDYGIVTAVEEHCYIRSAPGLNGEILYTVPVGASATYLYDTSVDSRGVTWYYATYNGITGWMSGLQVEVR